MPLGIKAPTGSQGLAPQRVVQIIFTCASLHLNLAGKHLFHGYHPCSLHPIYPVLYKVTISIPAFDLFPHTMITPICTFQLTYFCTHLELFPRG
jgi:hypothetical protein